MTQNIAAPARVAERGVTNPGAARGLGTSALVTLLAGAFLPMLSFFIINVALPAIGTDLNASPTMLQLVVASYGIANAALVVVGGRIGDARGRRRMFVVGMIGFAVTSLICGLAPNIATLLVARVAQGATASLMTPQVLATIAATLSGGSRARAVGLFGAAGGVAAAAGQILGGVLVTADIGGTGWRPVFLVNVPIAVIAVFGALRLLPETRATHRLPLDAVGAGWLALTLVALLYPLSQGRALGWPLWTWGLIVASVLMAAGFVAHQGRIERSSGVPLIPPSVLRLRGMVLGLVIGLLFFTAFGGFMFAFSLAVQGDAGLSALEGGLALLPLAVGFLVASVAGPRLGARWGATIIVRGAVIQAVGYAGLAVVTDIVWPDVTLAAVAAPMLVAGVGSGFVMMPLFGVVLAQVPPQQAGLGSGILMTMQQTCLALGAAVIGTTYVALAASGGGGNALVAVEWIVVVVSVVVSVVALGLRQRRAVDTASRP